jgi:hypothetical protein
MSPIFVRVLVSYLILFSVFWIGVKFVLKSEGFPFTLIWAFRDFNYLYQLVRSEADPSRRAFFRGLLFCLYALVALFPILLLLLDLFAP